MARTKSWGVLPVLLLALAGAGLGACALDEVAVPSDAVQLESQVLLQQRDSYSSYKEPARLVIRDANEWQQVWPQLAGTASAMPAVDFDRHMVLVAAMGVRSSGGYGIVVDGVFGNADGVYVRVQESVPGPGCGVTAALTTPVTVVTIPRRDGDVFWLERSRTRSC